MPAVPPPAAVAQTRTAVDFHVAAGRQPYQQFHVSQTPAHRQGVVARGQEAKEKFSLAQQFPGPAGIPPTGPQDCPISGTEVLHDQPDAAQAVSGVQAQGNICLAAIRQAEVTDGRNAAVRSYCSSLALTRYSPAFTPPNRYFPAVLVLVVAISSSLVTPATVTTWYKPTKHPATA